MDYTRALQILALKECLTLRESPEKTSDEFKWRKICRWYSKNFFTPLHEVENLPRYDIICAYYEDQYAELDDTELHEAIKHVTRSEEEAVQEESAQVKDKMSLESLIQRTAEEEALKMQNAAPKNEEEKQRNREKSIKDAEDTAKLLASLGETIDSFQKNKIDISSFNGPDIDRKQDGPPIDFLGLGEGDY